MCTAGRPVPKVYAGGFWLTVEAGPGMGASHANARCPTCHRLRSIATGANSSQAESTLCYRRGRHWRPLGSHSNQSKIIPRLGGHSGHNGITHTATNRAVMYQNRMSGPRNMCVWTVYRHPMYKAEIFSYQTSAATIRIVHHPRANHVGVPLEQKTCHCM